MGGHMALDEHRRPGRVDAEGQVLRGRVVDFIVSQSPDVISFNEIMRYSSSSQPQMIADRLRARTGRTWTYHWIQKSGASSGEGECVMTHLDIAAEDDYLLSASRSVADGTAAALLRVGPRGGLTRVVRWAPNPTPEEPAP